MTIKSGHPEEVFVSMIMEKIKVYGKLLELREFRHVTSPSAGMRQFSCELSKESLSILAVIEKEIYEALDGAHEVGQDIGQVRGEIRGEAQAHANS